MTTLTIPLSAGHQQWSALLSIKKVLIRIGIVLAVTATVAIGQTPASVKIGALTWTKQNINIETPDSWCYDDNPSNCEKYGRLYTYDAAKNACTSMGGGWRLPNNWDWDGLMMAAGGVRGGVKADDGTYIVYHNAGKKLRTKSGWDKKEDGSNGNGTDKYGFSAMPSGYRGSDGGFGNVGLSVSWWNATESGACCAYMLGINRKYDFVLVDTYVKGSGFAVRCVTGD